MIIANKFGVYIQGRPERGLEWSFRKYAKPVFTREDGEEIQDGGRLLLRGEYSKGIKT